MYSRDSAGNEISLQRTSSATYRVTLYLSKLGVNRTLGVMNTVTKTLTVSRTSKRHLMRKLNAYGLNDWVLHHLPVENVHFIIDGKHYEMSKQQILDDGKYLNFQQQGFELQIFVTVETLNKFKHGRA